MVQCNINGAMRYHEFVIGLIVGRFARGTGGLSGRSVRNGSRKPIGLHLCPNLRHIVPEHDDIVLLAGDVPHMVAQQRLGLEPEAFEDARSAPV